MQFASFILSLMVLLAAEPVFATQAHGAPEGIYAHQFAHLFFTVSMVIFLYWLRQRNLIRYSGWKHIRFAAIFFILWNITVLAVHFLDEQTLLVTVEKVNTWQIRISSPLGRWMEIGYYIGKMDHLLCVPALIFLLVGLKKLLSDSVETPERITQ